MKKHFIKRWSFLILFLSLFYAVNAQESLNSVGGNIVTQDGSVSYSIGQTLYTYSESSSGNSLSIGVQQAYEIIDVSINNSEIDLNIAIYPNPTSDLITLSLKHSEIENLSYQLFDISGKLIYENSIISEYTNIQIQNLAQATYLLQVIDVNKNKLKTFKILKNN